MLKSSFRLVRDHFTIIASGFLLIFFSVFGQTVFIGVFLPDIREDLGMSQSETGTLYGLATFLSALIMIWTGKKFDDLPMLRFLSVTFIGLALGCFIFANVTGPITLFIAFLMLRQFGQGLMVFSASTSINRYLEKGRGRAVAISGFAAPIHIALFPPLALWLLSLSDWRSLWVGVGLFVLVFLWPLFAFLLKNHQSTTHKNWADKIQREEEFSFEVLHHLSRIDALKDWKFYALIGIIIIPAFLTTAIFFFQSEIAGAKDMTQLQFASSLTLYTILSITMAFTSGILIDKYGEAPSLGIQPILYFIGMIALILADTPLLVFLALGLIGSSQGIAGTLGGPVLARLYGTKHLGAIKSMMFSTLIVASAISPALIGILLDQGFDIMRILSWFLFYIVAAFCILIPVLKYLWQLHHNSETNL